MPEELSVTITSSWPGSRTGRTSTGAPRRRSPRSSAVPTEGAATARAGQVSRRRRDPHRGTARAPPRPGEPAGRGVRARRRDRQPASATDAAGPARASRPERGSLPRAPPGRRRRRRRRATAATAGEVPRFFRPDRRLDCVFASAMGGSTARRRADQPERDRPLPRRPVRRPRREPVRAGLRRRRRACATCLLAQESVAPTLEIAAGADFALVGIGGTDDACTMVRSGCLTARRDRPAARSWGGRRHPRQLRRRRRAADRRPARQPADRVVDRRPAAGSRPSSPSSASRTRRSPSSARSAPA